jgi:hypothetical protein
MSINLFALKIRQNNGNTAKKDKHDKITWNITCSMNSVNPWLVLISGSQSTLGGQHAVGCTVTKEG